MIKIPENIFSEIIEHSKNDYPIEACGYLVGNDDTVIDIIRMTNVDKSNEHFTFDPKEQFQALKYARSKGANLIAVYHSHPNTPARMSQEDIKFANDTTMKYLIYSVSEGKLKCFSVDKEKKVTEVEIAVI
ncbi:MAG: M67 family metallopeptidase [Melioribacter sp.]|nr:M67 family metallopeptidase [Melioribacter sp.]